jgi:hypothetical protein
MGTTKPQVESQIAQELPRHQADADREMSPATSSQAETAIVVSHPTPDAEELQTAKEERKPITLKKITWRATATAYWAWWTIRFLLGSEFVGSVASSMMSRLGAFLSAVGFAPVHSEYLPRILRMGWLLAIVGFKPLELVGLYIYIRIAPFTLLGYLIFREYGRDFDTAVTEKKGLRPPKIRRPALTTISLLLLGWFVLYGETTSRRALIAGAVLSGLLFVLLAGRAFQRVKPPIYPDGSEPASAFERVGQSAFTSAADTVKKAADAKKKMEVNGSLFIYDKWRWIWRRYALLLRGQAGRDRLHLLLLVDYVLSLSVLGAAAVLFWAIVAKLASAPSGYSLATFVQVCASYFLPNIKPQSVPTDLALWVQLGSSITAFILFVLFVGAAASLLPSRYAAYTERLTRKYRIARKYAVSSARIARALEKIKLSKPR